jgi:hypothetical protein
VQERSPAQRVWNTGKPSVPRPSRHPDDIPRLSRCDRNLHLLARSHQILRQQVRIVGFGHGDAGVPEDLRQLEDVAAGLEPPRAEGVAQYVSEAVSDLTSELTATTQTLSRLEAL